MSGQRIIAGLQDAVAGNFARVTIDGQTWVCRDDFDHMNEVLLTVAEALATALDEHDQYGQFAVDYLPEHWTHAARKILRELKVTP